MKTKTLIITAGTLIVLGAFIAFLYYSIPHEKPRPISDILKNPSAYSGKTIMIQGNPLILYSFNTPYGLVNYYALKDSTGQLPIGGDTGGLELIPADKKLATTTFTFVGEVEDVCVHGYYNTTSGKPVCDKKELGLVT
ncbi:MAG: hypothetical protein AABX25_01915 [Nanoarchaeota archaeon]